MKTMKPKILEWEDVSQYFPYEKLETFGNISHVKTVAQTDEWFLEHQYTIEYWQEYNQYTGSLDTQRSCETQEGKRFVNTLEKAKQMCQDDYNEWEETLIENN
jgi:hypothetical protein